MDMCMQETYNVEEIRKEMRTLASIDTTLLGDNARAALKLRMSILACKLQEALQ